MKHVMIDLETLGTGPDAVIIQIGACYFDPGTGEIGEKFSINVDAKSAVASGAKMDADTVYWWLSQSKEAVASILAEPREDIKSAFLKLNDFLANAQQIWSHATFDFVIISQTFMRLNIKPSFPYKAARDIRTLIQLAGSITVDNTARLGTHHNGLDDALHQVNYCVLALNKIKKRMETSPSKKV